ncbi:MAG: nuclear transport factor 2 family protein [Arenicella sp.]
MKKTYLTFNFLLLALGMLLLVGCMTTNKDPFYVNQYQDSLQKEAINLEENGITNDWVGQRFDYVMNHFKAPDVVERVNTAFAPAVYFNDTWHTHESPTSLGEYLKRTGERVHEIEVLIDDAVVSKENAYIRWNMTFTVSKGDEPIKSVGMTHLRFNQDMQIITYQDYWDGVEGFYRTLPVIGSVLGMIRKKLG